MRSSFQRDECLFGDQHYLREWSFFVICLRVAGDQRLRLRMRNDITDPKSVLLERGLAATALQRKTQLPEPTAQRFCSTSTICYASHITPAIRRVRFARG